MLMAGGKPTPMLVMLTLTMLMDGCCHMDSINSMQGIWHEIINTTMRPAQSDILAFWGIMCASCSLCALRRMAGADSIAISLLMDQRLHGMQAQCKAKVVAETATRHA